VIQVFIIALTIGLFLTIPAIIITGWIRWICIKQPPTISGILSTIALSLASASVALAVFTFVYARTILGFPFYDPFLQRIYRSGLVLAFLSVPCAVGGFWYPNAVRRQALALSVGMALFWILAMLHE
jgi:hypothetical protein